MKVQIIIFTFLLFSVNPGDLPEYKLAVETANKLMEETKSTLMKKMSETGPSAAIEECSRIALKIAREKEMEGWRVRRVSLRFRNPEDKPDDYEGNVLKNWELIKDKNIAEKAEIVNENGKKFLRYMKPIFISSELCLKCHGNRGKIPPEVESKLKSIYPDDRATGYSIGDLRGAVSIKIPLSEK